MTTEVHPMYYTKIGSPGDGIAYILRINPNTYHIIEESGEHNGYEFEWTSIDDERRKVLTKEEALALIPPQSLQRREMKRIVNTDNFGRDYPNESFLPVGTLREEDAKSIVDILNKYEGNRYWKVVEIDYELIPGFEP